MGNATSGILIFSVVYKKGTEIEHIDYFTRFLDPGAEDENDEKMFFPKCEVLKPSNDTLLALTDVIAAQKLESQPRGKGFQMLNNVIYFHGAVWPPPGYRSQIVLACHSVLPYRHHGNKKTCAIVKKVFRWPNMYKEIAEVLKSCLYCLRRRPGRKAEEGLLKIHPIPQLFHTIYVDFYSHD